MKITKFHITIIFIFIWNFSFSQYTNFTAKNGLPSNHVYRITQDNNGFIWFLTDKGLVKYNGTEFKTFTTKEGLPSNDIWDVRITPDNKVWFFTKASKLGYIENDKVYSFASSNKNEIFYPITINQNQNKISFSNNFFNYHLENKIWKPTKIVYKNELSEIIIHKNIERIFLKSKDSFVIINKKNKRIKSTPNFNTNLKVQHRGQVNDSLFCWMTNNSISLLNLNTLNVTRELHKKPIKFMRFSAVNNDVQFSGENYIGLLNNKGSIETINIPKKLQSHFSFIDKNKNLWMATFSNGVYFLPATKQQAEYQLLNQKVGKLQDVNSNIIANVYNKGFYKYDANKKIFSPFIKEKGFIYTAKYIKENKTSYYLTNTNTIINKTKIKNYDIARNLVFHEGYLYGNSGSGLTKINPSNYQLESQYFLNGARDVIVFKEKLFIAFANGIKQFVKDTVLSLKIGKVTFNKPIVSLTNYNNEELIMSTDGFGAYATNLNKIELLEKSNFLDVTSSYVHNNDIYLSTNKGVLHYKRKNHQFKLFREYTMDDGLNSNKINAVSIKNGNLITSSNDGISIIPLKIKRVNQFIATYIDKANYNQQLIKDNKAVKYSVNNHLQIKFGRIDFSENSNFSYEYQLKPIQQNWNKTQSELISFNNLSPKKYDLLVKSNEQIKVFHFEITPLWYQTTIAKTVFGLSLIVLVLGIGLFIRKKEISKQIRKLKANKKLADFELHALRSQMNPHFVFNSLNAIQYYITKHEIELSEKYLVKFSRLIRMFFDFSREEKITLQQEVKLLKGYLEIEKMRFGKNFKYQFIIDDNLLLKETKIPTMLLQPIVENAVNHGVFHNGGNGLIEVSFNYIDKNKYEVIISDDGVGMEKSKEIQLQSLKRKLNKHKTRSTQILKERVDLLNQSNLWNVTYKLLDNKKEGTTVQLTFTIYG